MGYSLLVLTPVANAAMEIGPEVTKVDGAAGVFPMMTSSSYSPAGENTSVVLCRAYVFLDTFFFTARAVVSPVSFPAVDDGVFFLRLFPTFCGCANFFAIEYSMPTSAHSSFSRSISSLPWSIGRYRYFFDIPSEAFLLPWKILVCFAALDPTLFGSDMTSSLVLVAVSWVILRFLPEWLARGNFVVARGVSVGLIMCGEVFTSNASILTNNVAMEALNGLQGGMLVQRKRKQMGRMRMRS
jgi:hypothetical protein